MSVAFYYFFFGFFASFLRALLPLAMILFYYATNV